MPNLEDIVSFDSKHVAVCLCRKGADELLCRSNVEAVVILSNVDSEDGRKTPI